MNPSPYEDRGDDFEEVIGKLYSFSRAKKELIIEYLKKMLNDTSVTSENSKPKKGISIISSLEQLVTRYPNVDFAGFISRDNDKEQYQLWKLIDAFEETTEKLGRENFNKLKITLIVFGNKISYVSNGTIAVNYERFSKDDLVKQLISMARQQG